MGAIAERSLVVYEAHSFALVRIFILSILLTFSVFLSGPYSGDVKFIADDERAWWLGGGRPAALIMVIVDRCRACGGLNFMAVYRRCILFEWLISLSYE